MYWVAYSSVLRLPPHISFWLAQMLFLFASQEEIKGGHLSIINLIIIGVTTMSRTALSKQQPASNAHGTKNSGVYKIVTNQILNLLEQGTVPWKQPWSVIPGDGPINVRGTPYRGANYFLLSSLGFERPIYLTYRQALEHGGNVKKGEHGIPVVYWKLIDAKESDESKRIPFLRYYLVFNIAQCENLKLPDRITQLQPPPDFNPIETAESIWSAYPNPPKLRHIGDCALYIPSVDEIWMPARYTFNSQEAFYSTLFHEMGHSTGHGSRLNRDLGIKHGIQSYSREELVAEMTSAFLCARAGISKPVLENQAAYLANWSEALKNDPKMFVTAAGKAQKAADFILGVTAVSKEPETVGELCA